MEDITKTGPVGLKSPLTKHLPGNRNINASLQLWSSDAVRPVGMELGELGYGDSQYDKEITSLSQARNINEFRAQEQPWYDQIANGAIKMISTAATTFLDGTLGTLIGLGTGIYNMLDDDPNTGFWRGMWDNAIASAMSDIQEGMENTFKNYRSEWEQSASVFERMFSGAGAANFWGDDILKNAGFTIGAAASIAAANGLGTALKGVGWLGKAAKGLKLVQTGAEGLEATKAGKVASWIGKTFISTQGEAAIEAFNATKDNRKDMENNLANRVRERTQDAEIEREYNISRGMSEEEAQAIYNRRVIDINRDAEATRNQFEKELTDAGNTIYAANIAALSISNNLTLGSMIRGGYGTAKSLLEQAVKTSAGKPITSAKEAGEALLRGNLKFDAPAVKGALPKALGHWALESTQEGLEEGVQNLASTSGQMVTQARMNRWVRDNTMLGTMINPEAEEDLSSYGSAIMKAYQEQFGALNSQGWTEVMAGFISGALGVPGMHRNSQGKLRPTWQGGLRESWETINGNREAVQRQADLMNKALTDNKFNDRVKHAVQQIAIKRGQDDALSAGDIRKFKNLEIQQLLSDAVFFRDMGMLDDYLAMYKELANGVTDQDIAEFKAAVKSDKGDTSALEKMSDDELKDLYQQKAQHTLEKVEQALKDYKSIEEQYGNKFSDETRKAALMEMAYQDALYWDTQRRAAQIRDRIEELERKENRTPLEEDELKRSKKAEEQLSQQALSIRETLNSYKNSPKKLQSLIEEVQSARQKEELYKKANEAINKYKTATTLQDVVDVYAYSPKEDREAVLTQAIEQTEGETKALLQQFKNYMGDVNTLEQVIDDRFPVNLENTDTTNLSYRNAFRSILKDVVNEMLSDESPVLSRETLKEKLQAKLSEFNTDFEDATANAQGVKVNDDGNFDFSEALNNGTVSEDDFEEVLDNVDTGETHTQIREGSDAEVLAQSAETARGLKELIDHLNFFINSLDKLDELRKAGEVKKKPSTKEDTKKGKKSTYKKKDVEEADEKEEEEAEEGIWGEEETEEPPAQVELLSEVEKKGYHIVDKEGAFGVTYHTIAKDKEDKKAKASLHKKIERTEFSLASEEANFKRAKTPEDKERIIKKMLDIIANNVIGGKTMKRIDAFLVVNSSHIKVNTNNSGSNEEHDNEKGQSLANGEVSLSGNQHPRFTTKELNSTNKKMVKYNGTVQTWLEGNGFNAQLIIDKYLGEIISRDADKKPQDKTPIHYIHNNKAQQGVIFLGIEYSKVGSIVPRDASRLIKAQDGKEYLIIGTLGWEASMPGTHEMYDSIMNECKEEQYTSDGWAVNTKHTNRIKYITSGALVKQALGDNETTVRDLREVLNPTRNPLNLEIEDLGWTIVEGTDEVPTYKHINSEASKVYKLKGGRPGQVYLHIPTPKGKSVPIYIETLFYQELEEGTPLDDEISKLIRIIADHEGTMQDKKSAVARLNDLLIFSKPNQIHVNDDKYQRDPNTIYITRNGEPIKIIDFNNGSGTYEDLVNAVKSINPRINISTSNLSRNPRLYLDSGVLRTDIAYLGTVNSKFFLYPTDNNNEFVVNKVPTSTPTVYNASVKERVYLNGEYVYYDGENFFNNKGKKLIDEQGLLKAAYDIKNGKHRPIKMRDGIYYDVNGVMYVDNGHGGLTIVDEELRDKVLKAGKKISKTVEKKERVKKEAKKIEDKQEPQVGEEEEEGDWDKLNQEEEKKLKTQKSQTPTQPQRQQPSTLQAEEEEKKNFTNGTNIDDIKSQEEIDKQLNASGLAAALSKRANKEKRKQLYQLVKDKFGVTADNNLQLMKVLNEKGIDISSDDLDTVIEIIENCRT